MYVYDIQFNLWHSRIMTKTKLYKMKIKESDLWELCAESETIIHAFLIFERAKRFWIELTISLQNLGYNDFRSELKIIILGDKEKDKYFNLSILLGKRLIYQNRDKRSAYSGTLWRINGYREWIRRDICHTEWHNGDVWKNGKNTKMLC